MNAFLKMLKGDHAGSSFPLEISALNQIGRGIDCRIQIDDPIASRVHAVIEHGENGWWVKDAGSRNGTYLNDAKINDGRLISGCRIRIGGTVLVFHDSEAPAETVTEDNTHHPTQTIVLDAFINPEDTGNIGIEVFRNHERAEDLLSLYQLSIKLLSGDNPDEVITIALELLHTRMDASVVGFLFLNDEGKLKPRLVIPEQQRKKVKLSESLTRKVVKERRAVRVQDGDGKITSLVHYAEAICVPLVNEEKTVGAIHVYNEHRAFRDGEFEFCTDVANLLVVALVRAQRHKSLEADHQRLQIKNANSDELIGESKPMQDLKTKIQRIAHASGSVLVRGESGAGKELVARALHRASPRSAMPMLSVNCAAIPSELMESQLFGHKKGAFTSAETDHTGWFEQADSGTLFLDEIGEMTLEGQAKLLRILEGHPFLPVGGVNEISVDVRVIAATNRDLAEFVKEKRFREDLYYRLSVFELRIPPLRDRGEDIGRLVDFFLQHFRTQNGRPNLELSSEARDKLLAYKWPGNVRQLRNVMDSATVLAEGDEIQPLDLALRDTGDGEIESLNIARWEKKLIEQALSRTTGNVNEAARLLGIGRATLYRKLKEYDIEN